MNIQNIAAKLTNIVSKSATLNKATKIATFGAGIMALSLFAIACSDGNNSTTNFKWESTGDGCWKDSEEGGSPAWNTDHSHSWSTDQGGSSSWNTDHSYSWSTDEGG